jgi:hypothetical protein
MALYHGTIWEFSDFAVNTFLQLILPEALPRQMYFGSDRSAALLRPKGRRGIW